MSYENDKLMNLEDGQLLLSAIDKRKADVISVSDTDPAPVKTLTDGADGMPMGVTVGIEPVQEGSGDPSPSNVRAISGWSAVKISRTGGNLFELNTVTDGYAIGETGSISSNSSFSYSALIPVKTGGKYFMSFISATASSTHTRIHGYNASGTWVQQIMDKVTTSDSLITDSFTIPSGVSQIRISYRMANTEVTISALDEYEITIPSTPGTVYGGTLTVNKDGTGKLVVDRSYDQVAVDDSWVDGGDHKFYKTDALTYENKTSATLSAKKFTSNAYPFKGNGATNLSDMTMDKMFYLKWQNKRLLVRDDSFETVSDFITAFANVPIQVVYLLKQEIEYTLTAAQVNALITSLHGENNIFADSGDVLSVEYSADTKIYVDEHNEAEDTAIATIKGMIAESDAPVATASHAIGDVFICADQLLRATSVIASGETISTGTGGNAEVISLAEYIAEVIASVSTARTAIVDGDTAVYNWLNPMMVLTKTNIGGDQEVTNSYRKVTRTGNHITFERTGNSTTSVHFNMTGAIEKYVDKDISQYITLPDLTGVRLFLVLKYNCHSYSGSAASPFSYHVRTWDKNAEHDVDVASISPDGTTVSSVIASNGICTIDIDSVLPNARANKNLNVSFFSRRSDMEAEFDLNIIAMPVTQTT